MVTYIINYQKPSFIEKKQEVSVGVTKIYFPFSRLLLLLLLLKRPFQEFQRSKNESLVLVMPISGSTVSPVSFAGVWKLSCHCSDIYWGAAMCQALC